MAVRSDANTMFDLCSDTQSAKTIKQLQDVVDSLSARLRTGLRSRQSASDVQALHKQISQLESEVNGLHDDLAAPAKLHIKVKGMLTLGVRDALAGHNAHRFIFHSFLSRLSQETQNLVVEKEDMSLVPGSQMEEGQDMEEDDVFGRSTVLKNRKDKETPAQSGGVQSLWTCSPTPFFQLRTFQSIRQHGRYRNRMGRVRGERAGVAPNQ